MLTPTTTPRLRRRCTAQATRLIMTTRSPMSTHDQKVSHGTLWTIVGYWYPDVKSGLGNRATAGRIVAAKECSGMVFQFISGSDGYALDGTRHTYLRDGTFVALQAELLLNLQE